MKRLLQAPACLLAILCASCIHVREKQETYALPADFPPPIVRGAAVEGRMDPKDGRNALTFSAMVYGFAAGTRMGPYEFQLCAIGREGVHREIRIHRVRYEIDNGKVWQEPGLELALVKPFEPTYRKGLVQAFWKSTGLLPFDFDHVERVTVEIDLSVVDQGGLERRTLRLPFQRSTLRDTEFVMAGVEIFQRIKNRKVPFEQLDLGANAKNWQPPAGF